MRAFTIRRWAGAAILMVAAPAAASAQEIASSLDQLRVLVRPGDQVRLTDASGHESAVRIDRVSVSALSVTDHGTPRTLAEKDIQSIWQRRDDPLSNGARNGFLGGAAFGLLVGLGLREYGGGVYIPLSIAIYGGLGAGIGVGIDALITSDQMIYDARARSSSAGWRIAPVITRERTGIAVSLGF